MRFLSIFTIVTILCITLFTTSVKPGLHKPFILMNPEFKISNLSQRPTDFQSTLMFRMGDVKAPVVAVDKTAQVVQRETPIIPSDINIIPSDFIQNVQPNNGQLTANPDSNNLNNSDKMLEQVGKMLESEIDDDLGSSKLLDQLDTPKSGCSICDRLKDNKVRSELIAWNKWRSDLQNRIMELSEVDAPYGTIFYFMFTVDNNRRIKNIKVIATSMGVEDSVRNVRSTIIGLNGDPMLKFPLKTNRKSVLFTGGFMISDYEQLSTPSDYRDFEYVQY